ncbi:MAG: DUF58 domain-containing protein [Methyloligellaceae bacterium]
MNENIARQDVNNLHATALELADRLPMVMFEARKVSHTVAHGVHGRKRAGPGDNFWQYRKFQAGDNATQIDWRKSASSSHLYIREREWEAAHTFWMWPNLSHSMAFQSGLAAASKRERAMVLMLALSQVMINGGERVGVLGASQPTASRNVISKLSETLFTILSGKDYERPLPPATRLSPLSECVIFSDCLEPLEDQIERLGYIASQGIRGHLVHILDPAEETFPYEGRTEFHSFGTNHTKLVVDRAEGIREAYQERLNSLKATLNEHLTRMNWSYLIHHTDRPASEALLTLYSNISNVSHRYSMGLTQSEGDAE